MKPKYYYYKVSCGDDRIWINQTTKPCKGKFMPSYKVLKYKDDKGTKFYHNKVEVGYTMDKDQVAIRITEEEVFLELL